MQSADTSGRAAKRSSAPMEIIEVKRPLVVSVRSLVNAALARLSPVTVAVAVTALLGAGLFVAYDTMASFQHARDRLEIAARSLGDEVATGAMAPTADAIAHRAAAFGADIVASIHALGADANALSTPDNLFSVSVAAGPAGSISLGIDRGAIIFGLWQRGLAVFAAALAAIALTLARRPGDLLGKTAERRRVQDVVTTIPFGVALWTETGELFVCNQHYVDWLHLDDTDAGQGRSYQDAITRLTRGGYVRIVNEGESNRILELHREDGSCLLIDERPLDSGGFVTMVTDITERKRTDLLLNSIQQEQRHLARRYHEEKLKAEAASRAKTSFLAHLSHDIRTPLNHIIGFAELMRQQTYGPLGDARYLNYIDTIVASGEKLLGSFATILDLAELESGSKPLREEPIDVYELLVTVMRRFSTRAGRAGLTFALGDPCDARLFADRFCLERMLGNLVENAIRFTPSGGKVMLAAYAAEDGVVLEVSDNGIGMSDAQLARLSQPFAYGEAAFTRDREGAGLGIAISRAIAELSGGRLVIDSSPALGTTVAISLPLGEARSPAAHAA